MMELDYRYKLELEKDLLFILLAPRDGLWLQRFKPGDEIVSCYGCRKVFYSDDWQGQCPLCSCTEPLYFRRANHLLARDVRFDGNVRVEYPLPPRRVRRAEERPDESLALQELIEAMEEDKSQKEEQLSEAYEKEEDSQKFSLRAAFAVFTGLSAAYAVFKVVMTTLN